ncbi:hypothetical protein VOLCADRAFT_78818 [Volvox carteri f. nagariensis]|uniref:Glutathione-disulfide reductase n=1 Tax=Volvox carteri f. nagariensis TaxID=3068 RepID=D8THZ5_VOLCA|nr:uncharacterized protein VOLCADRAFT_78818 [Volvox carteri f. nagariensis]EFJ53152.1 hypothetical protein VOLCADRAFT_78818 [Volvox carteri f. nagariensis]|eukprot:XP_002946157.1 hypothetical protein VOLCADRAFT_78818 [Volvox carteri f. nagariensis]
MATLDDQYDLVTIGAGSGGVRASRFAATLYGAKVACVELPFGFISSESVGGAGGTCVIRGCVPKKLLVYGAAFAEEFTDARGFGWALGGGAAAADGATGNGPVHDWSSLIKLKNKEIQRLNTTYGNILKNSGVTLIEGRGRILDATTVEVAAPDGAVRHLRAKNILLATGGVATKIPIEGAEHAIMSDNALALEALPPGPIAVLGAGYIATEFAGIFRGTHHYPVHLMFRGDKVLRGFDTECRDQVQTNLVARGVHVHPGCQPTRIEKKGEHQLVLHYRDSRGAGEQQLEVAMVMMATGRKPRVEGLGLEAVGVALDSSGAVQVDEYSRTSVPGIWAVGDVTNRINLTPVALMEGMAFAKSAFGGELTKPDYRNVASAVFCQPPLATVGYTEEQAVREFSGDIDVYVSRFRPMKYTISGRDEKTLMKLVVHAESDKVLGCHMVGPDAPEIMQGLAVALKCGATKAQFDATVGIHPTAAEEFVTMRTRTRTVPGTGASKL